MADADIPNPSRPTLPDTPDISLSAALAYALYRDSDDVSHDEERAFYRALNAAARLGDVVFRGRKIEGSAFELSFGPKNAVLKKIDATYFGSERGFDGEYNRINAFFWTADADLIQGIIDTDQSEYESYSNVQVDRDGFITFIDNLFGQAAPVLVAGAPMERETMIDNGNTEKILCLFTRSPSKKIAQAIMDIWNKASSIPVTMGPGERDAKITDHINHNRKSNEVTFSADAKTFRNVVAKMIMNEVK
jgi:hypothetical protein